MIEYDFYKMVYGGGSISEEDWLWYESRARDQLSRYKRIYTVKASDENSEAFAVCAIAEAMHSFDAIANGGAVQSASIGSVSTSYSTAQIDISPKAQSKELYRCACLYLDIYRG